MLIHHDSAIQVKLMAKLIQTGRTTYQLLLQATRLEIAFYEARSHIAEDRYSPIWLHPGERVTIHAWQHGNNDALRNRPLVFTVRCARDGIHCSDTLELHISEERPVPFLLFVRAEVEPFEQHIEAEAPS
jgi:hypothetical protein